MGPKKRVDYQQNKDKDRKGTINEIRQQLISNKRCLEQTNQKQQKEQNTENKINAETINLRQKYLIQKMNEIIFKLQPADDPYDFHNNQNLQAVFTYSNYGQKRIKNVSEAILHKRIEQAVNTNHNINTNHNSLPNHNHQYSKQIHENSLEDNLLKRPPRYFHQCQFNINQQKCHNCHKFGHFSNNCFEQSSIKCCICLGSHHFWQCRSKACDRCGDIDHSIEMCRKEGQVCLRCKKNGHTKDNCGVILLSTHPNHYLKIFNNQDQRLKMDFQGVRCMNRCQKVFGHPNCRTNSHLFMPKVYQTIGWPDYSTAEFLKLLPSIYQTTTAYPFK